MRAIVGEAGRGMLADTNGGEDWIDAAAVTGNMALNLNAGMATKVNGVTWFTIAAGTTIENAITGDGNDTITGNAAANMLYGMRGNDTLNGGLSDDLLDGGAGKDAIRISGTEGVGDTFNGGSGTDTLEVLGSKSATLSAFNATASSIEKWVGNDQGLLGTSGANTFNFSGLTSKTGLPFVDGGGGKDTIIGSKFSDDLRGGASDDTLSGVDGSDVLTGGEGRDICTGGTGADRFDFNSKGESSVGSSRDRITDFNRSQKDKIDLKTIDANTKKDGDQAFKFIGDNSFSKKAGELRYKDNGDDVYVQGDVNGDGKADFEIRVEIGSLKQADFIL
jgi:Ca2+-binding RTX toxin-like protein